MMATTNDVTGDAIKTKAPSKQYRDNYEAIFSKDKEAKTIPTETMKVQEDDRTEV
jgi:nitric oxide reductase large subunit